MSTHGGPSTAGTVIRFRNAKRCGGAIRRLDRVSVAQTHARTGTAPAGRLLRGPWSKFDAA
jgi:hypothetical protein